MNNIFVLCITLLLLLNTSTIKAQDSPEYIRNNAIPFTYPDTLNQQVYKVLSDYRLIMIGEMHGTREPAQFVRGLTRLLLKNGDSVQIGLEIPSEDMKQFYRYHSDSSVYSSWFFNRKPRDGWGNHAWANIIIRFNRNSRVKIFFFDGNQAQYDTLSQDRDSVMFWNVKQAMKENPGWKTITLSGNIHNMLSQFDERKTMGYYLKNNQTLVRKKEVASIVHRYKTGTMKNRTSQGLKLRNVDKPGIIYDRAVDETRYLLPLPREKADKYNMILYTRQVTTAAMVHPD